MFRLPNRVFTIVNPFPGVNSPAVVFSRTISVAVTVSIFESRSCAEILAENKAMTLREKNKNTIEFSDRNKLFIRHIPFLI
jgi:hypothetical protein